MIRAEAKDLGFSYADREILSGLSLVIEPGELLCLLGPSGCGKSTLLRLLAGLLAPTHGRIERSAGAISFVFQDARLLPWKTVEENVLFPFALTGLAPKDPEPILKQVGLWEARGLFPHQLSGGMQQRAAIARALLTEPSLLLMDEPFSALDESTREELEQLLRDLWQRLKVTLVFVTHSLPEAVFIGERVVVLGSRGRLLLDQRTSLPARGEDLRTTNDFNAQVRALSRVLRQARSLP